MIPVILSGGSGTRLWPVSRRAFPKQFNEILDESLLVKTIRRLRPLAEAGEIWVVGVEENRALTEPILAEQAIPKERAIFEPVGRNTAPATALLCHRLLAAGRGEEIAGIFPADHLVREEEVFRRAARLAERCAGGGPVVTLGIPPTRPDTGYGYIEVSAERFAEEEPAPADGPLSAFRVRGFHEKPDAATARRYLEEGGFYWNAGIFFFRVSALARHLTRLMPELARRLAPAASGDPAALAAAYDDLEPQSLDHGVMERLEEQVSIPCDIGWSDVGSWDEVARLRPVTGDVVEMDGTGSFVFPYRDKLYALLGVDDLLVIDTADALLVARRGRSQEVKELVERLWRDGRPQAAEHPFEHRPWGGFEVLRDTPRFKSKILRVRPGHRLSYQSHRERAEHWVIVQGHPEVVLDDRTLSLSPGDHVFVPRGAKHRIRNPGEEWVELVEIQLGSYFGEDDIVRYEDDYERA